MEHYTELACSLEETAFLLAQTCKTPDWADAVKKFEKQCRSVEMLLFSNQLDAPQLKVAMERFSKIISQTNIAKEHMAMSLEKEREPFAAAVRESVKKSELVPKQPLLLASAGGESKELAQLRAKVQLLEKQVYTTNRSVILHIVQASSLAAADPNGLSDAYVSVKNVRDAAGNKISTAVAPETLNPIWDETFEINVPEKFSFNLELFDWSKDRKPQYLGYTEIVWSDWSLEGLKEERRWLPVEDGSGTMYVGMRAARHDESAEQAGVSALPVVECNCCKEFDSVEAFGCEKCNKLTCPMCIWEKLCHLCADGNVCKRKKLLESQKRGKAQRGTIAQEIARAKLQALMLEPKEWIVKRYEWPKWQNPEDPQTVASAEHITLPKAYLYETPGKNPFVSLEMLDDFETFAHFTSHLIKVDVCVFIGSASDMPVCVVVERISDVKQEELLALVYSTEGTARRVLKINLAEVLEKKQQAKRGLVGGKTRQSLNNSDTLHGDSEDRDLRAFLKGKFPSLTLSRVPWGSHKQILGKLLEYERNHTDQRRRVGVLFVPAGETDENKIFHSGVTPDLTEFLEMLGEKVRLLGWDKYAGGLNIKEDTTGTHSYYTEFLGFSIMFHVNGMLMDDGSEQQLARKRFIGNDLVVIVFMEKADDMFDPSVITSQMCHTFIVVRKVSGPDEPTKYRINIVAKPGVPAFTPDLPGPNILLKGEACRNFLLAKALNANRATFCAKTFVQKTKRTRKDLLARMHKDLVDDGAIQGTPLALQDLTAGVLATDNQFAKCVTEYSSDAGGNLSMKAGDQIFCISANPDEQFWVGATKERIGRFPADKTELIKKK